MIDPSQWIDDVAAETAGRKPVLVGESNPYGSDPRYALYPAPQGCAGERLCYEILGMRMRTYLKYFRRVNLCPTSWSIRDARRMALSLLMEGLENGSTRLILLGSKVAGAFGVSSAPFQVTDEIMLVLPHPSGRCLVWNQGGAIERARACLREFLSPWPELTARIGEIQG